MLDTGIENRYLRGLYSKSYRASRCISPGKNNRGLCRTHRHRPRTDANSLAIHKLGLVSMLITAQEATLALRGASPSPAQQSP